MKLKPSRAVEDRRRPLATIVIERDAIGNGIGADGGFADDGGGSQHGFLERFKLIWASGEGGPRCLACITNGFFAGTESLAGTVPPSRAFHERNG